MKSSFRATALLSSSSIISILVSLASAKVMALCIQPEGYGYYGLLQSFVAVASLLSGMGMATGLVRLGAGAVTRNETAAIACLRRASWWIFSAMGVLTLVVLWIFRARMSQIVLGVPDYGNTIMLMGLALLFTVAGNVQVGTLNAYHKVGALAEYGVANTLLSAGISIGAVIVWRVQGIGVAVLGGAIVSWVVSSYLLRREVGAAPEGGSVRETLDAAWSLIRFGGPYTASMLVGSGVQLVLPIVVLHLLNTTSVGYYRAAAAISVGYLGFLVTAMGQDYFPRVSAAADQPAQLVRLINEQHRLVMLVAVPMILGTLALVPYMVPLIYSLKFGATVSILEWQLIGDLFKFASWTMSFAILARSTPLTYFLVESFGGVVTLGSTWLSVKWFGLPGLGIGFLVTYVIYYCVVAVVIRREVGLRWTNANKWMMAAGVTAALVIRILPATRFASARTAVALGLALAAGIPSLIVLWREFLNTSDKPLMAGRNAEQQAASL
jgi:PST family polysaccharide transporter